MTTKPPARGDVILEHDDQVCTAVRVSELGSYGEQWSDRPDEVQLYLVGVDVDDVTNAELLRYEEFAKANGLPVGLTKFDGTDPAMPDYELIKVSRA